MKRRVFRKLARNVVRDQRGQSMVEYVIIASMLLTGSFVTGMIFMPTMLRAYDIYYKSFYAILNLPIP